MRQSPRSGGAAPLTIDVDLVPALAKNDPTRRSSATCIVVDVIRATTTLTVLFDGGCAEALLAADIGAALAARQRLGRGVMLAGEAGGARPPGFDLGNSPAEIAAANVHSKTVIFVTTNGTRALRACQGAREALAGSLRNAAAVCGAAVASQIELMGETAGEAESVSGSVTGDTVERASEAQGPERPADIVVVCAGRGGRPAYDDTLCAGYLARALARSAATRGVRAELAESARIAVSALEAVELRGGLREGLASAEAARAIARIGLSGDLDWCATTDASRMVPRVVTGVNAGELLVMRASEWQG